MGKICIPAQIGSPDTAAQLIQLCQPEFIRLVHDNGIDRGDVYARFNDMTPEVIDLTGVCCGNLPADDYHAQRWVDTNQGPCNKTLLLTHPMSVVRRGPVMLARTKRLGCSEEEMFSGETIYGKQAACAAQTVLHSRMLTACRVTLTTADGEKEYLMCDVASAANKSLEDAKYFTMYV